MRMSMGMSMNMSTFNASIDIDAITGNSNSAKDTDSHFKLMFYEGLLSPRVGTNFTEWDDRILRNDRASARLRHVENIVLEQ